MTPDRCKNCVYFDAVWKTDPHMCYENAIVGTHVCSRYPPVVLTESDPHAMACSGKTRTVIEYVYTDSNYYCGEHKRFYPPNKLDEAIKTMGRE